MSLKLIYKTLQ